MVSPIRILYIDDYQPDQKLIRDTLAASSLNYQVTGAMNYDDFVRLTRETHYDLVISELNVLDHDGLEIIPFIQKHCKESPIIILTGSGSEEIAANAFKNGAADYIIKALPNIKALPVTLQEVLQKHSMNTRDMMQHNNERGYQRLVEGAPDAIVVHQEGRIVYSNPAGLRLIGATDVREITGQSVLRYLPERPRRAATRWLRNVERNNSPGSISGIKLLRPDGGSLYVDIVATPFLYGKNDAVQIVIRNVTSQKRREQRLAALNDCFLNFGKEPDENIKQLVATCGSLLNAERVIYRRLSDDFVHASGPWHSPASSDDENKGEGYICYESFRTPGDRPVIIRHLQSTAYLKSDPNVQQYNLQTFAGIAVKWNQEVIGALSLVFCDDITLSEDDLRLMNIIAVAIGVEEERQQAQEVLDESQERFRLLVNSSFDGVFIHQNGIIVEANQAFFNMTGGTREKIINRPIIRFVAPETRQIMLDNIDGNNKDVYEVVGMDLDGKKFPMEIVGRNCIYRGQPAQIVAVHDISERIRSEVELQEQLASSKAMNKIAAVIISENRSENILEKTATIVGETLKLDRSLIYHFSFMRETESLCEWINPLHPGIQPTRDIFDLKQLPKTMNHIMATQMPFESHVDDVHEKLLQDKAGALLHQKMDIDSLLWYPFAFSDEGFYLLICNQVCYRRKWRDKELEFLDAAARQVSIAMMKSSLLSEQKMLEQQLFQSRKMESIGTLAGGIAHDFNNILAAIIGYSEVTLNMLPEAGVSYANLKQIYTAAQRGKSMVQQILTFSHQNEHEMKPVEIKSLIKEALKLIRATMPMTIKVRRHIDEASGVVLADPAQIHQILMNLCINAYYAMQDHSGELDVYLAPAEIDEQMSKNMPDLSVGKYVRLAVKDNGPGIPADVINRIFDPFFTTKPAGEGTGMGLAVVHGIVKAHNGAITVKSEPGEGALFEIYLPHCQVADKAVSTQPEIPEIAKIPRGAERVLLVDDEAPLIQVGEQILAQLGYEVTTCGKSTEALAMFSQNPHDYDLVVSDHAMPDMTGVEMAKEMKQIRPDLPIIIMSGFGDVPTQEKARKIGVNEFLSKPVFSKELGEAIRRVLTNADSEKNVTA